MGGEILCGFNTSELRLTGQVVQANLLSDCLDAFPNDLVDWNISHIPGMITYYSILTGIATLVVVCNLSIIVGILRDKKLRKQTYMIQLIGQAATDMLVGTLVLVFHLGTLAHPEKKFLGEDSGCTFYGFSIVATCHCTVFSLSWIAYVRKVKVLDNGRISTKRVIQLYAGGVWALTLVIALYYSLVTKSRMVSSGAFCNPIYNAAVIIPCALFIILPILFIIKTYHRIHKMMMKTAAAVQNIQKNDPLTKGDKPSTPSAVPKGAFGKSILRLGRVSRRRNSLADDKKNRQQSKATRLMILMCASILVAWTPLYIYFAFVVVSVLSDGRPPGKGISEQTLGLAATLSSLCSPVIYGLGNRTISHAMLFAFLPLSWKEKYSSLGKNPSQVFLCNLLAHLIPSLKRDYKKAQSSELGFESSTPSNSKKVVPIRRK